MKPSEALENLESYAFNLFDSDDVRDQYVESIRNDVSEADADAILDYFSQKKANENTELELADKVAYAFSASNTDTSSYIVNIRKEIHRLFKQVNPTKQRSEMKSFKENKPLVKKVINTVIEDSAEVAYRIGAKQLAKSIQEPVTNLLLKGLNMEDSNAMRAKISFFLGTEIGFGLISLLCSFGVGALPLPLAAPVLGKLAKELRIQGEMVAAEPVAELVLAPLRQILTEKLLELPIPGLPEVSNHIDNDIKVKPKRAKKIEVSEVR